MRRSLLGHAMYLLAFFYLSYTGDEKRQEQRRDNAWKIESIRLFIL